MRSCKAVLKTVIFDQTLRVILSPINMFRRSGKYFELIVRRNHPDYKQSQVYKLENEDTMNIIANLLQ